jgi:hypothetical protein
MPFERVASALDVSALPAHITVSKEPVNILLREAAVLVYTGATFPPIEALAVGVPVVYVEPEFALDLDPLGAYPSVRLSARSSEEILESARKCVRGDTAFVGEKREHLRRILRELIGKVDENTCELFVR